MTAHKHEWIESKPGTVGAGAAAVCKCGLYRLDLPPMPGDTDYYERAAAQARTVRLLTEQGYHEVDPVPADKGSSHDD